MRHSFDRRTFVRLTALGAASSALGACGILDPKSRTATADDAAPSHLRARPGASTAARGPMPVGVSTIVGSESPQILLYVPPSYVPNVPAPLAVTLHGAGQTNTSGMAPLRAYADALGLLLVAPQSVGTTWDMIYGPYGADVAALDGALARVFADCNVDPTRIALTGFSDGASYALSLGLTNGDLFTRLVAFSPGILNPAAHRGRPPIFVSHGTSDPILNIDRASRTFVPALRKDGYDVTYREFDGVHQVPTAIAAEAAQFIARNS